MIYYPKLVLQRKQHAWRNPFLLLVALVRNLPMCSGLSLLKSYNICNRTHSFDLPISKLNGNLQRDAVLVEGPVDICIILLLSIIGISGGESWSFSSPSKRNVHINDNNERLWRCLILQYLLWRFFYITTVSHCHYIIHCQWIVLP